MSTKAVTPKFRVSWPKVFKPELNKLNHKNEYSVVALFPKGADLTKLKAAAHAAAVKNWGADTNKWPKNIRSPFRDQAERAKYVDGQEVLPPGYEKGAIFLNLKCGEANKPGVVDENVQPILDPAEFYSGCFAIASVNAFAYPKPGAPAGIAPGISFGLQNIQKVADGDPLGGGRTSATEDFQPIPGALDETTNATDLFKM